MNRDIYLTSFLEHTPRLLGQMNANPASRTYGCCDRAFWHNAITVFPNARYQEAALTLSLLFLEFDTPYRASPILLELIERTIAFWCKIQEKDGSFNEWYLREGSYVATAFSSYSISESLLLLGKERLKIFPTAVEALRKAGLWLKDRSQTTVSNQQTGALVALQNIYLLTGETVFLEAARQYEGLLARSQDEEGWFKEYAGMDLGYLSLAIDYLAKYYSKTNSSRIAMVIHKAIDFLHHFVLEDGTVSGVVTSRETEYLIPHGFELWSEKHAPARFIAGRIRENLKTKKGVSLHSLDDRYLMYVGYTYLQAGKDGPDELPVLPRPAIPFQYLPHAGLCVYRAEDLELIGSLKKTGSFVCRVGSKRCEDSGVVIDPSTRTPAMAGGPSLGMEPNNKKSREQIPKGQEEGTAPACRRGRGMPVGFHAQKKFFSGFMNEEVQVLRIDEKGFEVEGNFYQINENIMTPFKNLLLNLFQMTLGRFPWLNQTVKDFLRKKLILTQKKSAFKLKRRVDVNSSGIAMTDEIIGPEFSEIILGAKVSFIYVPSSRWFQIENLDNQPFQRIPVAGAHRSAQNTFVFTRHFP